MKQVIWEQAEAFIEQLNKETDLSKYKGVYGVPRGGLVLAVMLSHKAGLPLLLAPCDGCIIVDDIADTGETLNKYAELNYYIATMYYHKQSSFEPDFWLYEKTDEWIQYPWEVK